MSFYRSDTVNHYKLILPRESAWEIMNKFGTSLLNKGKRISFILLQANLHFFPNHLFPKSRDVTSAS